MIKAGTVSVEITADTRQFENSMSKVKSSLNNVSGKMSSTAGGIKNKMGMLIPIARGVAGAFALVGGSVAAVSVPLLKMAGDFEQSKIAFTTMLGSAKKADTFLKQLFDFAAKTPFEFEGLQQSSRLLMAYGFKAKEIIPIMTKVGDAVSGLGGGAFEIDRVVRALGQMNAKTKVSAQEMNQLAEIGISGWDMLAKKLGITVPEAMKRAEKGMISSAVAIPAILDGLNKKFKGMMDKQSNTLLGKWSTLKDNLKQVGVQIGTALIPVAKQMLDSFNKFFQENKKYIPEIITLTKQFGEVLGVVWKWGLKIAGVFGPLLEVLRKIGTAISNDISMGGIKGKEAGSLKSPNIVGGKETGIGAGYKAPKRAFGGYVNTEGLYHLHAGEKVVAPRNDNRSYNINVNGNGNDYMTGRRIGMGIGGSAYMASFR